MTRGKRTHDLFEPLRSASPADRPERRGSAPAYSVSELVTELRDATRAIGQIWVRGEVSGLKVHRAGHWYFTLRDAASQLRCVMWQTYARRMKGVPPEGTEVFLLATPDVWAPRGDLRLAAVTLLPTAGVGVQQLALARTRELLERDGLFDPSRKRMLPRFPRVVAVVTSLDGAALRDIVTVAKRRWPAVQLHVVPTRVQGDGAVDELVRALDLVNRLPSADVCIVARGGGARDDLFVFNSEPVCRAVAAVTIPTVSAVGHETDVTLVDLVADVRAATPSAAAAITLPDREDVARHVSGLATRLAHGLSRRTRVLAQRIARLGDRAHRTIDGRLAERRARLERAASALDALSPLAVLSRGYSVARTAAGSVVRRRAELPPGTPFTLRVSDGDLPARAE